MATCTTKQAATRLDESPNRLYHHVEKLEKAGFIALHHTKPNRGTLEKYYRAVARQFVVDHCLLQASGASQDETNDLVMVALNALELGLAEVRANSKHYTPASLFHESGPLFIGGNMKIKTSPERFQELIQQWEDWLAACQAADSDEGEAWFSLTFAFFPLLKPPSSSET